MQASQDPLAHARFPDNDHFSAGNATATSASNISSGSLRPASVRSITATVHSATPANNGLPARIRFNFRRAEAKHGH